MDSTTNRPLRVFLCHSSTDKPVVRELYDKLRAEPWIQPWLDEEELYPGQDWNLEIEQAVETADAIIVCLSNESITKEGYVQREIRIVLDYADYKPEGTLYVIPVRLEDCTPPRRLARWQYANYFAGQRERGLQRLLVSLKRRAEAMGLEVGNPKSENVVEPNSEPRPQSEEEMKRTSQIRQFAPAEDASGSIGVNSNSVIKAHGPSAGKKKVSHRKQGSRPVVGMERTTGAQVPSGMITLSNGMELVPVPEGKFLMGSPKENKLAYDYERPQHTVDIPHAYFIGRFPVTNEHFNTYVKAQGIKHPVSGWENRRAHPVVSVRWNEAVNYCRWLNEQFKAELPSNLILRLPTEAEWEKAARGTDGREFPWGTDLDEKKCNTREGGRGVTTPVGLYSPSGDSPYGCADMAGNVWEWTHCLLKPYPYRANDGREDENALGARVLRGGSFLNSKNSARCAFRCVNRALLFSLSFGFRVAASPGIRSKPKG